MGPVNYSTGLLQSQEHTLVLSPDLIEALLQPRKGCLIVVEDYIALSVWAEDIRVVTTMPSASDVQQGQAPRLHSLATSRLLSVQVNQPRPALNAWPSLNMAMSSCQ